MKAWLANVAREVEVEPLSHLETEGRRYDLACPSVKDLNLYFDFPNEPLPWFHAAGQRFLLYREDGQPRMYKPADPDAEEIPIYQAVSATEHGGVSVWKISDCDYVAGLDLGGAAAWYMGEHGIEPDEIDFEAKPEDLDTLIHSDDGDDPVSFRGMIIEALKDERALPFVAASTEV